MNRSNGGELKSQTRFHIFIITCAHDEGLTSTGLNFTQLLPFRLRVVGPVYGVPFPAEDLSACFETPLFLPEAPGLVVELSALIDEGAFKSPLAFCCEVTSAGAIRGECTTNDLVYQATSEKCSPREEYRSQMQDIPG